VLCELEDVLKQQILNQFARLGKQSVTVDGKQVDLTDPNLDIEALYAAGAEMR